MRMRIRSINVERLIALVEQNKILYDRRHPFFRSIERRELVWKEISQLLNAEIFLVKNKWMTLRNTYKKYGNQRTTWKWGPYFRFMEEHLNLQDIPSLKDMKASINNEKESNKDEEESIKGEEESIKDEEEIEIKQYKTELVEEDPLALPNVETSSTFETENKDDVLATSQTSGSLVDLFKVEVSCDNDNKDFPSGVFFNTDTSTSIVDSFKLETTSDDHDNKDLVTFSITTPSSIADFSKEDGE